MLLKLLCVGSLNAPKMIFRQFSCTFNTICATFDNFSSIFIFIYLFKAHFVANGKVFIPGFNKRNVRGPTVWQNAWTRRNVLLDKRNESIKSPFYQPDTWLFFLMMSRPSQKSKFGFHFGFPRLYLIFLPNKLSLKVTRFF